MKVNVYPIGQDFNLEIEVTSIMSDAEDSSLSIVGYAGDKQYIIDITGTDLDGASILDILGLKRD